MQELEKILEKLKRIKDGNRKEKLYAKYPPNSKDQEVLNAYSQGYEDGTDNFYNAAAQIIRNHMNDGWIPVECKLPKTNGIYNVARHIDGHFISDSSYFDGQNTWHSDNRVNHSRPYLTDVIAWQPLPEPYRPERSDNNDRK